VIFFFFISLTSWRAITAVIAAAVTSSRIPSSSSQLWKLEPMCGFFRAILNCALHIVIAGLDPAIHVALPLFTYLSHHFRFL
jgi:hypothetical protein